ncbi:MAG: HNH endonuclease signature motif containing protein [Nocardioides sp.]
MDSDLRTDRHVGAGPRGARRAACREVELVVLAAGWADAHPDLDPAPVRDWKAGAPFAAAIGVSTAAGEAMIRDALTLRHRLPRVWARLVAGELPAWRARRIARAVYAQPGDVADWLDETLAPLADRVGAITVDRLLDEAMLLLHPEERELAQFAALDARHATLHEDSINHTGVAEMTLRGDWKDLSDFDATLAELAALLDLGESLDVRRSRAVGVLADPAAAAALLAGRATPAPKRRMSLVVHLSADAVAGCHPVGRNQTTGRAVLEQQVSDWCGRTDTHLTVTPVIDLTEHVTVDRYEVGDRLRTRTRLSHPCCVFPWCTRPARSCDADHVIAHAAGGATCDCNLAPLCRRHHRLKTSAGWSYTTIETGVWLWSDPHGQQFLRNHTGTTDVTPPGRRITETWAGCRHGPH